MKRKIKNLIFLCVTLIQICKCSSDNGEYFTVTGSQILKPNKPYRAAVFYQGYKNETILEISLIHKGITEDSKNVTLFETGFDSVDLTPKFVQSHGAAQYVLKVVSEKTNRFESSRKLQINKKQYSAFIQTDKSLYKPADKIQFRVLLLDETTRPYKATNVQIYVTDGADNRLKQFDNPQFRKGVYENELQLSDSPVLGKWKIHVKVGREKPISKEFEVAEYTLPKFEVSIDVNPDSNYKEGKISATVKAKYTFGKIAKGNATLIAEGNKKVSRSVEVNGKKNVEFKFEELGIQNSYQEKTINLFATFTEELSGKVENATAKVQIHITPHKIKFKKSGEKFKPGLPYKITALVSYHDKNAPVTDGTNALKFTTKFFYDVSKKCHRPRYSWQQSHFRRRDDNYDDYSEIGRDEYDCVEEHSFEEPTDIFIKNGRAELKLDIPSNTTKINVEAKYFETLESVKGIEKAKSESNQYIHAKLLTEKPTLKDEVKVEILTTHDVKRMFYQVSNHGIIYSKIVTVPESKKFEVQITPLLSMTPKCKILFYYITSDGEIISDKVNLEFSETLPNEIDIKLSSNQTKPGDELKLSVTSTSGSFVGLLGVDQSVLLLKKGNDIELKEVFEELESFNKISQSREVSYADFKSTNIHIITNAKEEFKEKPRIESPKVWPGGPVEYQMIVKPRIRLPVSLPPPPVRYSNYQFSSASASSSASFQSNNWNEQRLSFMAPSYTITTNRPYPQSAFAPVSNMGFRGKFEVKQQPVVVRKEFPETWIFDSFEMNANESNTKVLTKKVPDTITSWIITGFSVDPIRGLGLTKEASKLNVFQPFFVTTNLPYSIKRGEVSAIPIVVFNYLESDLEVDVTLFNSGQEFEFLDPKKEENDVSRRRRSIELFRKKRITVKSNEGTALTFMIRSLKVGKITIKVNAESDRAGDALERKLLVEPEGIPKYENEAILINLNQNNPIFTTNINISIPNEAVPDSTKIEATVSGDVLGSTIENLDSLIKLPYGCGEQNMLNFVPNIVVLDYLTSVNQLTSEIDSKAKGFMETGYQKELTYKHNDGSYSAFGKSDSSGSTWLTAFVAKSFNQASKYIKIDPKIINEALKFLSRQQHRDGHFPEVGYMLSKSMQGGVAGGSSLSAYTLITFLENKEHSREYQRTINNALKYIESTMHDLDDTYAMAITAYALQLSNHTEKDVFLDKLDSKSHNEDGMKFWKRTDLSSSYNRPDSINIEMTSYALLAFIEAGRDLEAHSIMKWLVTQRNENGGFQSTQDTIVGLQALAKISSKTQMTSSDNVQILLNIPSLELMNINVNAENKLILQKRELPSDARYFEIVAEGQGISVLQIAYKYNLPSPKKARFVIKTKVKDTSNKEFLHLSVCTSFIEDSIASNSNMAVMEVTLPSGFTFDSDHKPELLATEKVKKVETKDGDTIVIVYFDDIITREICPEFKAYRTNDVAKQKPVPVVIYDYYDTSRRSEAFYEAPAISLCDICGDDIECADACESDGIETAR